jgi:hypothetical protein
MKIRSLAVAGLFVLSVASVHATTIAENFTTDPSLDGWRVFGNTNQFHWNPTNQNLEVVWDSTQTNSYFFHPLSGYVTRNDDFSIAFDLQLCDIASGVEPGKTGPMQLGFGFLNTALATSTNFMRGGWGDAPNVAEFDYYTGGFYTYKDTIIPSPATTTASFIDGSGYDYCPSYLSVYENELPLNQTVRVTFCYTASNQTASVSLTTNGVPIALVPDLGLNSGNGFLDTDDFNVDMFSVSSYSSFGDDYDSVRAHGTVANLIVTLPPPAQNLAGVFNNGGWQVQFTDHAGWLYTLERSVNFQSWTSVSPATAGNGTNLFLADTNAPGGQAFYRIRADRP